MTQAPSSGEAHTDGLELGVVKGVVVRADPGQGLQVEIRVVHGGPHVADIPELPRQLQAAARPGEGVLQDGDVEARAVAPYPGAGRGAHARCQGCQGATRATQGNLVLLAEDPLGLVALLHPPGEGAPAYRAGGDGVVQGDLGVMVDADLAGLAVELHGADGENGGGGLVVEGFEVDGPVAHEASG